MSNRRMVHIVDDEDAVRRSVSFLLKAAGFDVLVYTSGIEFLSGIENTQPGCIILDIRMPKLDGLEVQRTLTERGIDFPVVMLTGHGDVTLAVRAIKAGAIEFIEKPFEKASLLRAVEEAFASLGKSRNAILDNTQASVRLARLTPRECDVLNGLVFGHPNKIIAYNLGISTRTVEVHRANLMHKLEVESLSAVLRLAFAAGWGNSQSE